MKRRQTTHIVIHTAAAARLKPHVTAGKTKQEIEAFLDNFDGDKRDIYEAVYQSAETIRNYHVKVKGWVDIGYHYLIRKDGRIEKGRPESHVGAHCRDAGMNRKAIGICCSGHGDIEPFTAPQVDTLCSLVNILQERKNIPLSHVIGHRETGAAKTCPGTLVDMNELRHTIDEQKIIDGSWADINKFYTLEEQLKFVQRKTV